MLVSSIALALVALQIVLFFPIVSNGRASDLGPFRVDGLALVYGTTWALAFAIASVRVSGRQAASLLPLLAGLLGVAYAREPFVLYIGWEVAAAGLWPGTPGKVRVGRLDVVMHLAGAPLLAAILLGLIPPFAPPPGGAAEPWHPAIVLVLAAVILLRIWLALRPTPPTTGHQQPTTGHRLYAMAAPILLVKALVAAPLDPLGIWMLTLTGTSMLLVGAWLAIASGAIGQTQASGWAWIGCVMAGLGLAPGTPLAAAGAVWMMLAGTFLLAAIHLATNHRPPVTGHRSPVTGHSAGVAVGVGLPGIWLIAQGALDLRYGVVAALLLPCLLLALLRRKGSETPGYLLPSFVVALALAIAAYPQLPVAIAIRPAVQAMAGGVGALSTLGGDWGVGLMVRPAQSSLSAGLPATGLAVAIFLAFVTLYWLRRAARRMSGKAPEADAV